MTHSIVQEVCEARAEIAAEFGHDRARFWAWARAQQEAERQANHQLPITPEKTDPVAKPHITPKRRVRPASASA